MTIDSNASQKSKNLLENKSNESCKESSKEPLKESSKESSKEPSNKQTNETKNIESSIVVKDNSNTTKSYNEIDEIERQVKHIDKRLKKIEAMLKPKLKINIFHIICFIIIITLIIRLLRKIYKN